MQVNEWKSSGRTGTRIKLMIIKLMGSPANSQLNEKTTVWTLIYHIFPTSIPKYELDIENGIIHDSQAH